MQAQALGQQAHLGFDKELLKQRHLSGIAIPAEVMILT